LQRGFSGDFFEGIIEVWEIIKPGFIADLGHLELIFFNEFAGVLDPDFV
jgi:hypothetical protein